MLQNQRKIIQVRLSSKIALLSNSFVVIRLKHCRLNRKLSDTGGTTDHSGTLVCQKRN